jgi:tetratricopeptide (TPR) repeat protein
MPWPNFYWVASISRPTALQKASPNANMRSVLDRNLAAAHNAIGLAKWFIGRADETEGHSLEALRLSPRDKSAHRWMITAGGAKLYLDRDEEAVSWFRRAIETNRNYPLAHFFLATPGAPRPDERGTDCNRGGLTLDPTFTIRRFRVGASRSDHPTFLAQRERVYDGMRKAGVPEG